jgi:hypothetical protein
MMVMIPIGPTASKILSAQPMDIKRSCFVACSPKRVKSSPNAVTIVSINDEYQGRFLNTGNMAQGHDG